MIPQNWSNIKAHLYRATSSFSRCPFHTGSTRLPPVYERACLLIQVVWTPVIDVFYILFPKKDKLLKLAAVSGADQWVFVIFSLLQWGRSEFYVHPHTSPKASMLPL